MIEEYKLETRENPSFDDLKLEGEYVCLEIMSQEKLVEGVPTTLYRKCGEGQSQGGKNNRGNVGILPGLYNDSKKNRYYIKIPKDPKEMFCEMFHGALVNQLKLGGYLNIEEPYISGAEGIVVEVEGSKKLALSVSILPDFNELFGYLGTAKSSGKERDNVKEITNRGIYSKFVEGKLKEIPNDKEVMKRSLALCILQSVAFFGDYSFHSSNVALYDKDKKVAKIDGGAAFRSFAKNSPVNILFPHEYTGMGFHNTIHKNYIDYYTRIPGLKEYLPGFASYYINMINVGRDPICDIVLESIRIVKETYAKIPSEQCPFKNKAFSQYFGMDLSIDETLLAKQFEGIIYRNIKGFQRIKTDKKQNNSLKPVIKEQNSIYSIQAAILQMVLSRGKDVRSKEGNVSQKDRIKNTLMDNFKNSFEIKDIDFFLYLHLLCTPSRFISFSSKTADTLASGLSRLAKNDPARRYLGISPGNQKVSSSDLMKSIKKTYEKELNALKNNPKMYPEYLIRLNGNSKVW
ncbi:hypothetical protein [Francisella uliginis]|uniref:LepB N-terminal domain-containing protein n=1 Tax=Francisella uliginis TaxID=573570 RepID=A0A1L4BUX7_9GAMM|nr:hypothetical protein [Francisella uliginis]API87655.1 hypothetical protein F7310_09970 [Francisella uliginis]